MSHRDSDPLAYGKVQAGEAVAVGAEASRPWYQSGWSWSAVAVASLVLILLIASPSANVDSGATLAASALPTHGSYEAWVAAQKANASAIPRANPVPVRVAVTGVGTTPSASGSHVFTEGEIKNHSPGTVESLEVIVRWYDGNETFITSEKAVVEDATLEAGQSSPFKIVSHYRPAMERGKYSVDVHSARSLVTVSSIEYRDRQ